MAFLGGSGGRELMGFFVNQSICPMLANWIWELWRIKKWCRSYSGRHCSLRSVWMQSFSPTWFRWGQPRILTLWLTSVTVFALARLQLVNLVASREAKRWRGSEEARGETVNSSFPSSPSTRDCFSFIHQVLCVVWNIKWYSHMLHLLFWAQCVVLHNFWVSSCLRMVYWILEFDNLWDSI